ncbi:MAG: ABC transporter substrate-binding protein [Castellaniella sp.]|uniref:ABC transporter substrate-binding protein n=1 Tax=Castellaniella sp. TaxID=1955812 RepID=UPI003C70FE54
MSDMTKTQKALRTAAAISAFSLFSVGASAADLTIASWGGAYQKAQSEALFVPAAKALGMDVKQATYNGMSDVRLQVQTGAVTLDIVASGSGSAARAGAEGLLEPLDYQVIDVSHFYPTMKSKFCVGGDVFSNVFAWNTEKYGKDGQPGPKTWADFWDVKKFPGKRAYRGGVAGSLEPALMADGVPPDQVYAVLSSKGGIERAINKIRQLKPNIAVWWSSGAQHAQLMKDGEVDMATGWNGRFDDIAKHGAKVTYSFDQGLLDYDCFAIPKGAPHKDAAMKFLAEISKAKYQAGLTQYITYGPTNKDAYSGGLISDAVAKTLPSSPANAALQIPLDIEWYEKFEKQAAALYQDMMLE